jgi:hypothetical protein
MTGWNVLNNIINNFPPVAAATVLIVAAFVFIVGFSRRGINFLKYGFGQTMLDSSIEKRFDSLEAKMANMATKDDLNGLRAEFKTELETIKVNHFGHLKNFLTELTSILLDKGIINNENKARLDNNLRGM